jgi:hypothetical protein
MKNAIYVTLAMSLLSATALADSVKFWVNEPEKIVAIATNPTLSVQIAKLEVDDSYYARIDVSLNYSSADMDAQVQAIMASYPGYQNQRVVVEKSGQKYHYQIPSLGIALDLDPKPGVEGPYIDDTRFLTKAQFKTIQAEIAAHHSVVQVDGSVIGTVPLMKVAERKELSPSICNSLVGADQSVSSTFIRFAAMGEKVLSGQSFQYDSTRAALLRDVTDNCLEVIQGGQVDTFKSLLSLKVRAKSLGRNLVGETLKKVYEKQEIPLVYQVVQQGAK